MRISKTVSITLPPDMLARALQLAKAENRTMSELIREALRSYEFRRKLREIQNSPSARATRAELEKLGSEEAMEQEIIKRIKGVRKISWPAYKRKRNAGVNGSGKKPKK